MAPVKSPLSFDIKDSNDLLLYKELLLCSFQFLVLEPVSLHSGTTISSFMLFPLKNT